MLSALFIACLAAAAPGAIVLQVLPRLAASDASTVTQAALGTLLPLAGALLGGLLLRAMTHRSSWVGAALGLAAQAAGVPEFVSIFSGTVALGYLLDTGVYTALFGSYVVLGGALAALAAGPASVPSATMSPRNHAPSRRRTSLSSPPVWESVSRRPEPAKRRGEQLTLVGAGAGHCYPPSHRRADAGQSGSAAALPPLHEPCRGRAGRLCERRTRRLAAPGGAGSAGGRRCGGCVHHRAD